MNKIAQVSIDYNAHIIEALKKMDVSGRKLLILLKDNRFISLVSIGDIQRALIAGIKLDSYVKDIVRLNVKVVYENDDLEEVKALMKARRNEFMPVLSSTNEVVDIIFWEDLFDSKQPVEKIPDNIPVVLMAGGKGSRLKPLTNILPKPLIPIGERTILEDIIEQFTAIGCNQFFISVNYKAEMIRHYFTSLKPSGYTVEFIQEDRFLGTAGSLFLLKNKITSSFFVSNCDIIVEQELADVYSYHTKNKNDITIVSALKHYHIPYGTLESSENGILLALSEKPQVTFQINTGLYLLEKRVLQFVPDNSFFHITELVTKVKETGGRVGVFPVSEGSWKDIGEWESYINVINTR